MNCYRFCGTFLKVHYVITIKNLSKKFIQYDYIIYNIVVLSFFFHFNWLYLIIWPLQISKSCKNYFVTTFYEQCNVLSPINHIYTLYNLKINKSLIWWQVHHDHQFMSYVICLFCCLKIAQTIGAPYCALGTSGKPFMETGAMKWFPNYNRYWNLNSLVIENSIQLK